MSGKGSRARRVEATRRAYADVYRLCGAEMPVPPFGNERQDRIYAQQYANYRRSYWHMERMHAELAEAYGMHVPPNKLREERDRLHVLLKQARPLASRSSPEGQQWMIAVRSLTREPK